VITIHGVRRNPITAAAAKMITGKTSAVIASVDFAITAKRR
jgi:hypothetical protein